MPLDQVLLTYYRKLLKFGFEHAGSIENPSIFLDSIGENVSICTSIAKRYIHLFIAMNGDTIDDIKYLCMCDPTANVAIEVVCLLVKGKTIEEAKTITIDQVFQVVGGESEALQKSAEGLFELLQRGFARYEAGEHSSDCAQ